MSLPNLDSRSLLAEYLAATRTSNDKGRTLFNAIYDSYYKNLSKAVTSVVPAPELVVVYTLQRQVELVSVGASTYLVYDQYLGQTMNMLNRIVLNSRDPMDGEMYLFKLLAEEAAARGRLATATIFGINHIHLRSRQRGYRKDKDSVRRAHIINFQERFVLAHELAHLLIDNDNNINRIGLSGIKHGETLDRIASQLGFTEVGYEFAFGFAGTLIEDIPRRSSVELECLVDAVATLLMLLILGEDLQDRGADFIIALALCLRHLRLIGMVRDVINGAWNDEAVDVIRHTRDYMVRTSSIRRFLSHISRKLEIASPELVDVAEDYERLIDDPLMFSIVHKLRRFEREFSGEALSLEVHLQKIMNDRRTEDIRLDEVLSMTGFLDSEIFRQKAKSGGGKGGSLLDKPSVSWISRLLASVQKGRGRGGPR